MTSLVIKPCPCCGSESVMTHIFGWEGRHDCGIALECLDCGCGMSNDIYKTKEQIIEAWNKRTEVK